jgi:hypothetical protein
MTRKLICTLPLVLTLGCGGLLPQASMGSAEIDPRCVSADERYESWYAVGVVFTSLGAATTGGGIVSEFVTDEKWVPIGVNLAGIVFTGLGLAGNIIADDAAEDIIRYCEGGSGL